MKSIQNHKNNLAIKKNASKGTIAKLLYNNSHWEKRASKYKTLPDVSWQDIYAIELEIANIIKYLNDGDRVIDVGCSNGFSTFRIVEKRKVEMHAFDYSKKSIQYAKEKQKESKTGKKIKFYHGNALEIEEANNSFDKAYTIRVIINLLSWQLQKKAILEIHRILKPKGLFLMLEAFTGGFNNLNKLRILAGLKPLQVFDFNLFLNENKTEKFASKYFEILEIRKFSSLYYLGSRFIRPLTMNNGDKESFINDVNKFFSKFEESDNSGDFGVSKLYVLKKK